MLDSNVLKDLYFHNERLIKVSAVISYLSRRYGIHSYEKNIFLDTYFELYMKPIWDKKTLAPIENIDYYIACYNILSRKMSENKRCFAYGKAISYMSYERALIFTRLVCRKIKPEEWQQKN